MSAYRVHDSKITSVAALKAALVDRIVQIKRHKHETYRTSASDDLIDEWTAEAEALIEEAVEVYHEPVNLQGYQNDGRPEVAHVICRKALVNAHLGGGASNDVGFLRQEDGSFQAIISDYDNSRWWGNAAPRFWQAAMASEAETAALAAGYQLHRSEENGNIKLVAAMVSTSGSSSHGNAGW